MSQKLRTAVLGVGYLGHFHAQKHKASPYANLVGVFDANAERAQKIAGDLGVQAFTNLSQLEKQVDAVTISAVTQAHYELANWCLDHGIHVNVEKPITAELHQAQELVAKAKKKNLKLAVGHVERFNPVFRDVQKLNFNADTLILRREGPFKTRAADVSVLHDLMIHDVDLLTWLTGSEIQDYQIDKKKVFTQTWDWAEALVTLKNGMKAVVSSSRISVTPQRSVQWVKPNETLWAHLGTMEIQRCIATPGGAEPVKIQTWNAEKADALQLETDSFLQAILQDKAPVVTGEDGLKALEIIEKWAK